jgi:hypothetical protein
VYRVDGRRRATICSNVTNLLKTVKEERGLFVKRCTYTKYTNTIKELLADTALSERRAGYYKQPGKFVRNTVLHTRYLSVLRRYDMNRRSQMKGNKNRIFPKEINAKRFF